MKKFLSLTLITISLILVGCTHLEWSGFYYPNGQISNQDTWIIQHGFKDKESCLNWAENLKQRRGDKGKDISEDQFECGAGCELQSSGSYLCN